MTATIFYDNINEIAQITNTFTGSSGIPADPTTVSCVITDPSGLVTIHTYQGAAPNDIVKPLVGKYTLNVPCSPNLVGIDGLWSYVWIGTGVVSDVQPGTWRVLPSTVQTWYVGLEEMKDRLGITDSTDDSALQGAIQAASSWVNEYVGQHFYRITETRTFVPHDLWIMDIDPLVTITALNVDRDGDGTFEESWVQNVDYQLLLGKDRYNINALGIQRPYKVVQVIQTGRWFPFLWPFTHWDRVQIVGTWGWPSVPPTVAEAVRILAADEFKMKDAPFGVAGVSDLGITRIQSNPWIVENLQRFINPKLKVGV
jgi:hypothetical protein